jgi:rSAM/selenodomain-associated transferase 1
MPERRAATLAVMAKAPIPGYSKTRLIPRLGPAGAAELHALLLERTSKVASASEFDAVTFWCAPDRAAPGLAVPRDAGHELRDQPAGDLGARMLAAFRHQLAGGGPVVMIGTDCPQLEAAQLRAARAALDAGADATLLPAEDGGYALLGLARAEAALFEGVPWGTAEVLAATRARLDRLGWRVHELPAVRDVDRPEDVDWLLASGLLTAEERARIARHLGGGTEAQRRGGHG